MDVIKILNRFFITLIFIILFLYTDILSQRKKIHNFPIYSVDKKRYILYELLKSLPKDGFLLMNFTSVYCMPCKKEIPVLLKIKENSERELKLIFIYSEYDRKLVKNDADSMGIRKSAFIDLFGTIKSEFNIKMIPYTILVNRDGYIIGKYKGYNKKNINNIKKLIKGG